MTPAEESVAAALGGVPVAAEPADPFAPAALDRLAADLKTDLTDMIVGYESMADRSRQTDLGPSQIGMECTRCLARHALGAPLEREPDSAGADPWCRIVGTAVHAWLAQAAAWSNNQYGVEWWAVERRVHPDPALLPRGGSADLYDGIRHLVIDYKTTSVTRLRKIREDGPSVQYRRQAHLYGLGYTNAGQPVEHVAIVYLPRSGLLREMYVHVEPYDPAIANAALSRWKTVRDQARAIGPQILPLLSASPECWDCGGADVTPEEMASLMTNINTNK